MKAARPAIPTKPLAATVTIGARAEELAELAALEAADEAELAREEADEAADEAAELADPEALEAAELPEPEAELAPLEAALS